MSIQALRREWAVVAPCGRCTLESKCRSSRSTSASISVWKLAPEQELVMGLAVDALERGVLAHRSVSGLGVAVAECGHSGIVVAEACNLGMAAWNSSGEVPRQARGCRDDCWGGEGRGRNASCASVLDSGTRHETPPEEHCSRTSWMWFTWRVPGRSEGKGP